VPRVLPQVSNKQQQPQEKQQQHIESLGVSSSLPQLAAEGQEGDGIPRSMAEVSCAVCYNRIVM
jgi:hypothetical protein